MRDEHTSLSAAEIRSLARCPLRVRAINSATAMTDGGSEQEIRQEHEMSRTRRVGEPQLLQLSSQPRLVVRPSQGAALARKNACQKQGERGQPPTHSAIHSVLSRLTHQPDRLRWSREAQSPAACRRGNRRPECLPPPAANHIEWEAKNGQGTRKTTTLACVPMKKTTTSCFRSRICVSSCRQTVTA